MIGKQSTGRQRRKFRVRKKISGTADRPRMSVFRSNKHIAVQIIDDNTGHTLAQASTYVNKTSVNSNCDAAKCIGESIAEKAKGAGITTVVFDRNGYQFHGRVKALADAAREKGLKF